jgi:hypothetical protein
MGPDVQVRRERLVGHNTPPERRGMKVYTARAKGVIARYGLWQEAGRSEAFPVHWPLLPAPLPPSVGGDGFAAATGATATPSAATANSAAVALRIRLIDPFPRCVITPLVNIPVQHENSYPSLRRGKQALRSAGTAR